MKKTLMAAMILASTIFAANAQTGSILVGGDVNYDNQKIKGTDLKQSEFTFNPFVGYQFTNNLTAGVTASVFADKNENGTTDVKRSAFAVGPFLRYTQPLSNTFSVFGQLQALAGSSKTKTTFGGTTVTTDKASLMTVQLFPAVFINLKNNFGLNFNIGGISYGSVDPKATGAATTNTFNINFGKTLAIGVSKNFGGKK